MKRGSFSELGNRREEGKTRQMLSNLTKIALRRGVGEVAKWEEILDYVYRKEKKAGFILDYLLF